MNTKKLRSDVKTQQKGLKILIDAYDRGQLRPLIESLAERTVKTGRLPRATEAYDAQAVSALMYHAIGAELESRGLSQNSRGVKYEDWNALDRRIHLDIETVVDLMHKKSPELSLFENEGFQKFFLKQTQSRMTEGNRAELLLSAQASYVERERLFLNAKKSLHVVLDEIGAAQGSEGLVKILVARARDGVDVRVMVDGSHAQNEAVQQKLRMLEDNGVKVQRWQSKNPQRHFDVQHRQFAVVDGAYLISGGFRSGEKRRDTELLLNGPVVSEAEELFLKLWDEQSGQLTERGIMPWPILAEDSSVKMAMVNHQPNDGENIQRALLLAIAAAKETIDIQNAYFILEPTVLAALKKAKTRGVRVRIHTHAPTAIEALLKYPMSKSINELTSEGFEVYLQQKGSLDSKLMIVDRAWAWIGSYQFRPRSYRYDGEVLFIFFDRPFADLMHRMYEVDLSEAKRVMQPLPLEGSERFDWLYNIFFDQL